MIYEIHFLTGATLIDANGNPSGKESGGILSRHRTEAAALRAERDYHRACPCGRETSIVRRCLIAPARLLRAGF